MPADPPGSEASCLEPDHPRAESAARVQFPLHCWFLRGLLQVSVVIVSFVLLFEGEVEEVGVGGEVEEVGGEVEEVRGDGEVEGVEVVDDEVEGEVRLG